LFYWPSLKFERKAGAYPSGSASTLPECIVGNFMQLQILD